MNSTNAATRYLFECGIKLEIKQTTISIAALFFHKVFKNLNTNDYDKLVFAISCLYLAGKVIEYLLYQDPIPKFLFFR